MPISTIIQYANPTSAAVALMVEQSGMTVTVKAGSFRVGGVSYTIRTDQTFTAEERDEVAYIDARLVEYEGQVFLMVDEQVMDGGVAPEPFDWAGSPYKVLWSLFWFKVPAGATSLADVAINVLRVEAPPVEEPETEDDDG